jgi:uncharacterized protein (DUF58 family)
VIVPDPECDAIVRAFEKRETRARIALPSASQNQIFRHTGFSFDLKTIREYQPFDDPRAIDWKLYGRTNRAYVKEFFEEEADGAVVIIDTSASLDCFPKDIFEKFSYSLCYILVSLGFSLSVLTFKDRPINHALIKRKSAIRHLDSLLSGSQFSGKTDIAAAARMARATSPFKKLFVLSDFHDTQFNPAVAGFSDIYLVRFYVPLATMTGDSNEIEIVDQESHHRMVVPWDKKSQKGFETNERTRIGKLATQAHVAIFADIKPETARGPVYRSIVDRLYA